MGKTWKDGSQGLRLVESTYRPERPTWTGESYWQALDERTRATVLREDRRVVVGRVGKRDAAEGPLVKGGDW